MGTVRIKDGTPVGNESLCNSCSHGLIVRGFRETEELVFCTYSFDQPIRLPFKVYKCTGHDDRNRPTWEQMEKMAIDVDPSPTRKHAGFFYPDRDESPVDVPVDSPTMND
jgi:hypothetical protein